MICACGIARLGISHLRRAKPEDELGHHSENNLQVIKHLTNDTA